VVNGQNGSNFDVRTNNINNYIWVFRSSYQSESEQEVGAIVYVVSIFIVWSCWPISSSSVDAENGGDPPTKKVLLLISGIMPFYA
jgi:hypothetical protein